MSLYTKQKALAISLTIFTGLMVTLSLAAHSWRFGVLLVLSTAMCTSAGMLTAMAWSDVIRGRWRRRTR